jgi:HAMP domain-containing protein
VRATSRDEVGQLAAAFNQMAATSPRPTSSGAS